MFFELSRDQNQRFYCLDRINSWCDPHFHSNIEIIYVLEGSIEITVNGKTRHLQSRELSVANSYELHTYKTPQYSHCYILLIPTGMIESFFQQTQDQNFSSPFLVAGSHDRQLREVIDNLATLNESEGSIMLKGYLYILLGLLSEALGMAKNHYRSNVNDLMRKTLIYLEQHYTEALTLEDISHHVGYSKRYLSHLINANLNCSFHYYLNLLRARHAARLIHNTNYSIQEIAYQSGFRHIRTLQQAFQIYYGVSPMEYKKKGMEDSSFFTELHELSTYYPELADTLEANREIE